MKVAIYTRESGTRQYKPASTLRYTRQAQPSACATPTFAVATSLVRFVPVPNAQIARTERSHTDHQ